MSAPYIHDQGRWEYFFPIWGVLDVVVPKNAVTATGGLAVGGSHDVPDAAAQAGDVADEIEQKRIVQQKRGDPAQLWREPSAAHLHALFDKAGLVEQSLYISEKGRF